MWIKRMLQEHIKDDIPAILHKHYAALRDGKENVSELARVCDLIRPTVYKYLKLIMACVKVVRSY